MQLLKITNDGSYPDYQWPKMLLPKKKRGMEWQETRHNREESARTELQSYLNIWINCLTVFLSVEPERILHLQSVLMKNLERVVMVVNGWSTDVFFCLWLCELTVIATPFVSRNNTTVKPLSYGHRRDRVKCLYKRGHYDDISYMTPLTVLSVQ